MIEPTLLPHPKEMTMQSDAVMLPEQVWIIAQVGQLFTAQTAQKAFARAGCEASISAYEGDEFSLHLTLDADMAQEAYTLDVKRDGIQIQGDEAGLFYGVHTLAQLLEQYGQQLPVLHIADAPDFPVRGVMLDISRDRVPTMETLKMMVDQFASMKINHFELYTEHTFAYRQHPDVWRLASPMTGQQIMELDAYCAERFIELTPNQNSLGHMERWLKHPRYHALSEAPDGYIPPWGGPQRAPATIDPTDAGSFELIQSMYDEFLPHFSSKLFNVGCDEPFELGQGKNKAHVEERGGHVYLDWMLKLYEDVTKRGYKMLFWGDIIMNHPELVPELPKDITVLEWGYEADHPYDKNCGIYAEAGVDFWVCPGNSAWNTISGRTDNAMENIRLAAEMGLKHGATGLLNTEWGDNGHWQPQPIGWLGFSYGAAVSWGYENNKDIDIADALDRFVFRDSARVMGKLAYDLGNVYQELPLVHNGQFTAYALQRVQKDFVIGGEFPSSQQGQETLDAKRLDDYVQTIDTIMQALDLADMQRDDADLIRREFIQAANLLKHGAKWCKVAFGLEQDKAVIFALSQELEALVAEQMELWLARSRRGGLVDSLQRFDILRGEYARLMA